MATRIFIKRWGKCILIVNVALLPKKVRSDVGSILILLLTSFHKMSLAKLLRVVPSIPSLDLLLAWIMIKKFINIFKIVLHSFWKEICMFYHYVGCIILALLLLEGLSMDTSMLIESACLWISEMLLTKLEEGSDPAVFTRVIPATTHISTNRDRGKTVQLMNVFQAIPPFQVNWVIVDMKADKIYHKVQYQVHQMQ